MQDTPSKKLPVAPGGFAVALKAQAVPFQASAKVTLVPALLVEWALVRPLWTFSYNTENQLSDVLDPISRNTHYTYDTFHNVTNRTLSAVGWTSSPSRKWHLLNLSFALAAGNRVASYIRPKARPII